MTVVAGAESAASSKQRQQSHAAPCKMAQPTLLHANLEHMARLTQHVKTLRPLRAGHPRWRGVVD